jgi:hypothetical protein
MAETWKLAAILAADVAGYSRLAGADEERTLARLRALRSDLIDPTIALHHGRVVKRTGDGILIEFRSVVDAVRCAIEVLNGMAERNAGLPPERCIEFLVGIHLGVMATQTRPRGGHLLPVRPEGVDARLAAAKPARASSASSLRTRAYPFRPMHLGAPSSTAPPSRLALQRAISVSPCFSSAGSSKIFRPSVRTQAMSGLLVAHPERRASVTMRTRAIV